MLSDCSELKQFFTTSRWNGLKNKNIRVCVVIMNMTEKLNILDNYIADLWGRYPIHWYYNNLKHFTQTVQWNIWRPIHTPWHWPWKVGTWWYTRNRAAFFFIASCGKLSQSCIYPLFQPLVRIWPLHCSLGNQNAITCKLELHAIQLKGRCTSLHAKGPQGSGMQG